MKLYFVSFQRMFEVPNIKKFQETMNYLLNVIDSTRYKEIIEFPVLDKKAESKFRIGVKTFLMEINEVSTIYYKVFYNVKFPRHKL